MTQVVQMTSPFIKRFMAWSNERFPMANVISGALGYITMVNIGRFIGNQGFSIISWTDLLGAIAFIAHLLLLRIFDEHKDYDIDKVNHPERALSRGLITLKHLRIIALPLPLFAIGWSYFQDQGIGITFYLWALMFIYSSLMAKEFFIGEWLSQKLVLYSFSHMIVSPLMYLWILIGGAGELKSSIVLTLILILSFTGGISYELTRKTRGTDENTKLDAYNKHFGTKGSIAIITVFNILSFIMAYKVIQLITTQFNYTHIILILGFLSTIYPTVNFLKKQTQKARKINEAGTGLFFLGLYISLLLATYNNYLILNKLS